MKKIFFLILLTIATVKGYAQCSPWDGAYASVFVLVDKEGNDISHKISSVRLVTDADFADTMGVKVSNGKYLLLSEINTRFNEFRELRKISGLEDLFKSRLIDLSQETKTQGAGSMYAYIFGAHGYGRKKFRIAIKMNDATDGEAPLIVNITTAKMFYLGCGAGKFKYEKILVEKQ